MLNWAQLWLGALASAAVCAAAWRTRSLSAGGAVTAWWVGTAVFAGGGLPWGVLLLFFFLTGSWLTRLRRRRQGRAPAGRTASQVLANGLPAAVAGLLQLGLGPSAAWEALMAGSLAAMTADTWATELGLLSGSRAWRFPTGPQVPPGTSGGVSLPGSLGGVLGAVAIAWLAAELGPGPPARVVSAPVPPAHSGLAPVAWAGVVAGGLGGMLFDSLLGAWVQARYRCRACGQVVEDPQRHGQRCGFGSLEHLSGWQWLRNDQVNALAGWLGGWVAVATVWWR